jgi:hypothetical protein
VHVADGDEGDVARGRPAPPLHRVEVALEKRVDFGACAAVTGAVLAILARVARAAGTGRGALAIAGAAFAILAGIARPVGTGRGAGAIVQATGAVLARVACPVAASGFLVNRAVVGRVWQGNHAVTAGFRPCA